MRQGYDGIPLQRGKVVERDMFGEVRPEKERIENYVPFNEALAWVKMHQPSSPLNPLKPFAHELRIALQDKLGLETQDQMDKVRFYTAVGSALDHYHGTDAFIEVDADRTSGLAGGRVLLGITTRDKEGEKIKTDVEIWVPSDGLDYEDKMFDTCVEKAAEAISARLRGAARGAIVDIHTEH